MVGPWPDSRFRSIPCLMRLNQPSQRVQLVPCHLNWKWMARHYCKHLLSPIWDNWECVGMLFCHCLQPFLSRHKIVLSWPFYFRQVCFRGANTLHGCIFHCCRLLCWVERFGIIWTIKKTMKVDNKLFTHNDQSFVIICVLYPDTEVSSSDRNASVFYY